MHLSEILLETRVYYLCRSALRTCMANGQHGRVAYTNLGCWCFWT